MASPCSEVPHCSVSPSHPTPKPVLVTQILTVYLHIHGGSVVLATALHHCEYYL